MTQARRADTALDRLPGELVDWLAKPFALFIAGLAFGDDHLNAAKLGIVSASAVSAVLGTALLACLSSSSRGGASMTAGSTMRQIIDLNPTRKGKGNPFWPSHKPGEKAHYQ